MLSGQWSWRWQLSAPGRQYRAICSAEQQHAYEQDFETDYTEYRILHARVGAASQRFIELGAEIKRVQRGTPEHKVLEEKIVQEYRKFRKRYPGYREEKRRCEYLHQKLSHIKGLILEFEEKNRESWSCQKALCDMKNKAAMNYIECKCLFLLLSPWWQAWVKLLNSLRSFIVAIFYFLGFGHSAKTPQLCPGD